MHLTKIIKKPEKILEIDETVTKVIIKSGVQNVRIVDEPTLKSYLMKRTPVKKGLQMIGA